MSNFFNSNFDTLPAALDAASKRNTIIAQNIANAETPGYKRKEVDFEQYLQNAMGQGNDLELKKTDNRHFGKYPSTLEDVQARVRTVKNTQITNDRNNVDIDQQEAMLAANTLRYQTLSRLMSLTISRYNTVLKGVR